MTSLPGNDSTKQRDTLRRIYRIAPTGMPEPDLRQHLIDEFTRAVISGETVVYRNKRNWTTQEYAKRLVQDAFSKRWLF